MYDWLGVETTDDKVTAIPAELPCIAGELLLEEGDPPRSEGEARLKLDIVNGELRAPPIDVTLIPLLPVGIMMTVLMLGELRIREDEEEGEARIVGELMRPIPLLTVTAWLLLMLWVECCFVESDPLAD